MTGLAGGSVIGLSAATLLLFNGDIMGASGIVSTTVLSAKKVFNDESQLWKPVFISSFLLTSSLMLGPSAATDVLVEANAMRIPYPSDAAFVIGGMCVGLGTKLSNGCTSGHGVCGLGRRSMRSLTAVLSFLSSAMTTAYVTSPAVPWSSWTSFLRLDFSDYGTADDRASTSLGFFFTSLFVVPTMIATARTMNKTNNGNDNKESKTKNSMSKCSIAAVSGSMFAAGLAISNMVLRSKLYGFLDVVLGIQNGDWDPTLMTVLGGAFVISTISYEFVKGYGMLNLPFARETPISICPSKEDEKEPQFRIPTNKVIDRKLILGASIFGIGWGISLYCPGPALFLAATGDKAMLLKWIPGYLLGAFLGQ
eukprot:CAMPEP_0119546660 /NCGR_PEP_ID=MMETSP1352-20130426/978_1 /TAXON_ID=265584 /ORGANISM="Stauroneis constricta, Strain CCMP1120" /LENGTH=365 /DNA_ID=CAMNT_0007591381 /DNA_START=155 /DNA_END=1252 /DNA_ORIENTATION=-